MVCEVFSLGPRKRGNIVAETVFLGRANVQETMFPYRVNQETFHPKLTFAHVHFRKYSLLNDHRIQSTLFPRRTNGETFVAEKKVSEKIRNIFCFPETKNVSATNVPQQTGKHLGKHVSSAMFPQQGFLVCRDLNNVESFLQFC